MFSAGEVVRHGTEPRRVSLGETRGAASGGVYVVVSDGWVWVSERGVVSVMVSVGGTGDGAVNVGDCGDYCDSGHDWGHDSGRDLGCGDLGCGDSGWHSSVSPPLYYQRLHHHSSRHLPLPLPAPRLPH